jgi:glycosyltransferase involved in cell wall biosynthesis
VKVQHKGFMKTTFSKRNSPLNQVVVNGRFRVHRITGVQRYAHEIVARLGHNVEVIAPQSARGAVGHLWEQTILPLVVGGRLLWNPCGSGPLNYGKQIVTFHDLFPIEFPEWYSSAYAQWYSFVMRRLASRSLHLISVSHYTKARLVKALECDPEKITVIHNGLSDSCRRTGQTEMDIARTTIGIPSRRYLLSLSSLESRKNLRGILEAWSLIYAKLPTDVWLVLAGPKADASVYGEQALMVDLPRVFFTGFVAEDQLAGLYSGASLFLFPSLAEGFGLPLLEAMACGVRCITSNTTSLPEVGGDVVRYVDPLNPNELADAILAEMKTHAIDAIPYLPAIERARQFTWDDAASKTRSVLSRAAEFGVAAQQERNVA